MKRTLIAMSLLALGMGAAQAQDYQLEAGVGYTKIEADNDVSGSSLGAGLTYNLAMVSTSGLPLAEAAFLGRVSNLSIGYEKAEIDDTDFETDDIGGVGEFYLGQLYLRAGYAQTDVQVLNTEISIDTINARIGYVITDGFLVNAGVRRQDSDAANSEATNDTVIEAKYVSVLGGGTAMNVGGALEFLDNADDTTALTLAGDYYFNPTVSVGALVTSTDGDSGSTTDFGVRSRFFFTPTFSGELAYFTAADGDVDNLQARLAVRF